MYWFQFLFLWDKAAWQLSCCCVTFTGGLRVGLAKTRACALQTCLCCMLLCWGFLSLQLLLRAQGADCRSSEATSTHPTLLARNGHQWSPAIALSRAVPSLCSSDAESCGFRLREPLIPGFFCKILLATLVHINAITNFPAYNVI